MTAKIIRFNISLLWILIGMNYVPDLSHCFSVMNVRGANQLSSLASTHTVRHSGTAVFTSRRHTRSDVKSSASYLLILIAKDIITHPKGQLVEKILLSILVFKII